MLRLAGRLVGGSSGLRAAGAARASSRLSVRGGVCGLPPSPAACSSVELLVDHRFTAGAQKQAGVRGILRVTAPHRPLALRADSSSPPRTSPAPHPSSLRPAQVQTAFTVLESAPVLRPYMRLAVEQVAGASTLLSLSENAPAQGGGCGCHALPHRQAGTLACRRTQALAGRQAGMTLLLSASTASLFRPPLFDSASDEAHLGVKSSLLLACLALSAPTPSPPSPCA